MFPVMAIAMTSDMLTQGQIYDAADAVISQRLSQIKGVGGVNVNGSALPAVRVEVNPLSLSKYGIGLQDVQRRHLECQRQCAQGRDRIGPAPLPDLHERQRPGRGPYRDLIIANRNGATVRLGDVARSSTCRMGRPRTSAPMVCTTANPRFRQVFQQPGANIVAVSMRSRRSCLC